MDYDCAEGSAGLNPAASSNVKHFSKSILFLSMLNLIKFQILDFTASYFFNIHHETSKMVLGHTLKLSTHSIAELVSVAI